MDASIVILGLCCGVAFWCATQRLRDLFYRRRGVWIEQRAIAALEVPEGWELQPNLPVPGHGDADIYIKSPKGQTWNIEIKSYEGAKKAPFSFFRKQDIVHPDGSPFKRDPIVQVLGVANKLKSQPVLWMPRAPNARTFRTRSGVLVVQGSRRRLERAIGARPWWKW